MSAATVDHEDHEDEQQPISPNLESADDAIMDDEDELVAGSPHQHNSKRQKLAPPPPTRLSSAILTVKDGKQPSHLLVSSLSTFDGMTLICVYPQQYDFTLVKSQVFMVMKQLNCQGKMMKYVQDLLPDTCALQALH